MAAMEQRAGRGSAAAGLVASGDRALVARCLAAGADYDAGFQELYERYAPRVYGFLLQVTRDPVAAEDALQETFVRVYRSLERWDPGRGLLPWLLQIARYVAIDAHRVEQKVRRLEEARARAAAPGDGPPQAAAVARERREVVDEVLAELSPEDRSLLLLRHDQGLTFRAIGELCDCSSRTAQNRVEAAARRFQGALARRRVLGKDDL